MNQIEELNNEKASINNKIEDMKDQKIKIKEEIKKKKEEVEEEKRKERIIKREKPKEINHVNKLIRVSKKFDEEVEDIQKERVDTGEKPDISKPKLTELIASHKFWGKIKEDLINFNLIFEKNKNKNKKGQTTILMMVMIVGLLLAIILIFVGGITTIKINEALDQDLDMGQVNLKDINEDTFGKFAEMYLNNADWWGISIIFGMILGLFLSSYFLRGRFPKWVIVIDIFIIIAMFVVALYISSTYGILVDSLNSAGEDFLEVYIPKTSMFMLNLPIFVVIIGVISMILMHSSIPRRSEERLQQGGILQGVQ